MNPVGRIIVRLWNRIFDGKKECFARADQAVARAERARERAKKLCETIPVGVAAHENDLDEQLRNLSPGNLRGGPPMTRAELEAWVKEIEDEQHRHGLS